ncbi:MAG: sugar ABC transporter substrate-binding protein [Caldilineae bacterium]|nr:MAG: sugar ABC transporter substrate-binding protein [Caldilineae bacterium]
MLSKKLSRRGFLKAFTGAIVGGALAACAAPSAPGAPSSGESTAPSSGERIPITVMFWDPQTPGVRELPMKKWEETQDKYSVDYQWVNPPSAFYEKLTIMMASGQPPDLFILQTAWLPEFLRNNVLLDIKPYIDRENYSLDDYPKIAVDAYSYNGGFYGLPDNITAWCLYYIQEHFDEAGVAYPTAQWDDPNWTTDDFLTTCEKLQKRDANGNVTQYAYDISSGGLLVQSIWLSLFGGSLVDDPVEPTECTLDRPEAVAGLQFLADLRWKYDYAPRPEAMADMNSMEMVTNGRLSMVNGGGWGFQRWANVPFSWDIGHFPKGPVMRNDYVFYYPISIAKSTKQPDAAWELLRYYEDVAIKEIIASGGLQGTKISDMRNIFATSDEPPKSREVLVDAVEHFGILDPRLTNWQKIANAITAELDLLWLGEKSAEDAAMAAKAAADPLIAEGRISA